MINFASGIYTQNLPGKLICVDTLAPFLFVLSRLTCTKIGIPTLTISLILLFFITSSGLLVFETKPLVKKLAKKDSVSTNVYSIIGKTAIVIEDIDWASGTGQIKCEGEVWSAKTDEQIDIPTGSEVEIVSIEGVKAYVKPLIIVAAK